MGYSLSIALPTKEACDALCEWLDANFNPSLEGWGEPCCSVQRHPSYRPDRKQSTGFDYGPIGGHQRLYVWEAAYLLTRLAKGKLYYDSELLTTTSSSPPEWDAAFLHCDDDAEAEKRKIRAELTRLESIWRSNPPL